MNAYDTLRTQLRQQPLHWLITGVAGFIGSNLLEALLDLDQHVVGLDNFSTGYAHNLEQVRARVGETAWARFRFQEGDICRMADCQEAVRDADVVLHQAALGSVPRSIEDPLLTHANNATGFLNMLTAARDVNVRRFVYAASSSTYGDHPDLPKQEDIIGRPLSPYAVTKYLNELYADVYARCYGTSSIGLRYFNVFGPRQDPNGAYAAVIPQWVAALIRNQDLFINGDGETTRDFCFVENVVQANLLAACSTDAHAINQVYNIALCDSTSLNALYQHMKEALLPHYPHLAAHQPTYRAFRAGDIRHSQADISKARRLLGYAPSHTVRDGLAEAMDWYRLHL